MNEAQQKENLQSLVRKAMAGNEAAFGQIYDLYFEKVYRFVYFRVNHKQAAEDIVSEIFIRFWDRKTEIQNPNSFIGWLFQIARNLVIDYYRSRKPNVDLNLLENVLEYENNIVELLDLSLKQKSFLEVLKKLTPDQRLVIRLKFFDELKNPEIAEILDKSEGAIRVIQHRAITELKKLLNKYDSF